MTRATLYVLLPICFITAIFLIWQGVPQNFAHYTQRQQSRASNRVSHRGRLHLRKQSRCSETNGGGFFNANSAHPFENPTPLSNFIQMISIFLIPAGLTYTFGKMVGNVRQGWMLFTAMSALFLMGCALATGPKSKGNPNVARLGVETHATAGQPGGNMEGKETRFGISASSLFAVVTTDASCGAVNSMHDSFTPIGGAVPLIN